MNSTEMQQLTVADEAPRKKQKTRTKKNVLHLKYICRIKFSLSHSADIVVFRII